MKRTAVSANFDNYTLSAAQIMFTLATIYQQGDELH